MSWLYTGYVANYRTIPIIEIECPIIAPENPNSIRKFYGTLIMRLLLWFFLTRQYCFTAQKYQKHQFSA